MKTHRLSFEKGVNVISDKALMPDGSATILDNVNLRSGSPRPYKAPEFQFATTANTTRSWSYRGRWFHSDNWRDYAGEFIGGIERVYYTEEGKYPKKAIEGVHVMLGTPRPKTVLGVSRSSSLSPSGVTVTQRLLGEGNLPDGERLYRISAKTSDGILPPSSPVSVTIDDPTNLGASVDLTWGAVPNAKSYIIFEGTQTAQYRLDEVPASTLSYSDTGSKTAAGDNASQYLQEQEFTYAYTYKRRVSGVEDESGLSAPSISMSAATGRTITRDPANDGYFDTLSATTDAAMVVSGTGSIATSAVAVSLSGVVVTYDQYLVQTKFAKTAHGLTTGQKVKFTLSDPSWSNQELEIIRIDANNFAVKDMALPTDGSPLPATAAYRLVSSVVTYTAGSEVQTGDVVYLVGAGATQSVSGFYEATRINATSFSVPLLATESITLSLVKWVPSNGYYWKWCLYRNEQNGWFLVEELDLSVTTFTDAKPFAALSTPPSSYYVENSVDIDYDTPPLSLEGIVSHYGMLFGISGHNVRWTPILAPDAWPEVNSVTLAYKPVALASFSQGLIILCQDAIYRLDGNQQTEMSLSKTHAEDGCFAPHSVQKTEKGLVYLGRRGVMLFNGTHAECITDTRVSGDTLTGPSRLATTYPFWWLPTIMTRNYADLAGEDGIRGSQYVFNLDNTKVIEGYNKSIKSFYYQGKYYLFYWGDDYQGNTAFVIDMQMPGFPIATLGIKAVDAHVDEYENPFVLLNNAAPITTVTITSPL